MERLKKIKKSILLYSGEKRLTKNDIFSLSENFIYLSNLAIPKLYIFKTNKMIVFYSKSLSPKIKKEILEKYPKGIIVSIKKFRESIPSSNTIFTLSNYTQIPFDINKLTNSIDSNWLDNWCQENRMIKNNEEIKRIKISAEKVSQGIVEMWKNLSKFRGKTSKQIVSYLNKRISLKELAYPTICSTGVHCTDLHYHTYDSPLNKDSMVLLDIGYKYDNYCCDITRSFPISGKFNERQKILYEIVLECQKYILSQIKPGVSFRDLENLCYLFLFTKLQNIKILRDDNELSNSSKIDLIRKLFMYHRLGHPVGLEVHDIENEDILQKNMVYAIEPGIYFNSSLLESESYYLNNSEIEKYKSIGGIRIEDTIVITSQGYKILNKMNKTNILSKEIKDIEKIMSL